MLMDIQSFYNMLIKVILFLLLLLFVFFFLFITCFDTYYLVFLIQFTCVLLIEMFFNVDYDDFAWFLLTYCYGRQVKAFPG